MFLKSIELPPWWFKFKFDGKDGLLESSDTELS